MPMLIGEYLLTFDERGHIQFPAEVRRGIDPEIDGNAFFVVMGRNHKLWIYPDRYYEKLAMKSAPPPASADASSGFESFEFAMACRVELDRVGRILLPKKLLHRQGLQRDVTLIGVRDHLEIWNRPEWAEYRAELMARVMPYP